VLLAVVLLAVVLLAVVVLLLAVAADLQELLVQGFAQHLSLLVEQAFHALQAWPTTTRQVQLGHQ
jgi:hypothetical protein